MYKNVGALFRSNWRFQDRNCIWVKVIQKSQRKKIIVFRKSFLSGRDQVAYIQSKNGRLVRLLNVSCNFSLRFVLGGVCTFK